MKRGFAFFFCFLAYFALSAQRTVSYSSRFQTIEIHKNGIWNELPVITLGGSDHVELSFDELSHDFHHFYYTIEHCDARWQPTEGLFESEYLTGANGTHYIADAIQSFNTTVLYTHYQLKIPNEDVSLRLSGNYRVTIKEAHNDSVLLMAHFSVLSPQVGVSATVTTNTDIDRNDAHQQISIRADLNQLATNIPQNDIRIVVMRNNRQDDAVWFPRPTAVIGNRALEWTHHRDLIFKAGNEYRKFEILDDHNAYMGVDEIVYHDGYRHARLLTDTPRKHYLYDEDQDGAFVIRHEGDMHNDTESDYMFVHFRLAMPPFLNGKVYVDGAFTGGGLSARHQMKYDAASGAYELPLLLKQGYYNYQYLYVPEEGRRAGDTAPTEGNYFQTKNTYTIYIYNKRPDMRHEELVGFSSFTFSPNQ